MKWTDLAGLGIIGFIAYAVWSRWDDITGAISGTGEAVNQVNPFTQIPAYFQAQQELAVKQAQLEAKYESIEKDIQARKEDIARIEAAQTPYAQVEAYKESYESELAHRTTFTPFSIIYEGQKVSFNTAEEYLQWTLKNKGLTTSEIDYITGKTQENPAQTQQVQQGVAITMKALETQLGLYSALTGSPSSGTTSPTTTKVKEEELKQKVSTVVTTPVRTVSAANTVVYDKSSGTSKVVLSSEAWKYY